MTKVAAKQYEFTAYMKTVLLLMAFLQFTVVLDFTILSPLGAVLMNELELSTAQFSLVVSIYAISAGLAGLLAAGVADRFDRKRFLLFFYAGFLLGTLFCGVASNFYQLLLGRLVAGLFGGVVSATTLAIAADLFPFEARGRAMGVIQVSFAVSQVFGIPAGLALSNLWGWHSPFLLISGLGLVAALATSKLLRPIRDHLTSGKQSTPLLHLYRTLSSPRHAWGFGATLLLTTGAYMMTPFGSAYVVENLGLTVAQLPLLYACTGVAAMLAAPLVGKWSDVAGKFRLFAGVSLIGAPLVIAYTRLQSASMAVAILFNVGLLVVVTSRFVLASALTSELPTSSDRGAFMAVNASLQQFAGAAGATVAGHLVARTAGGRLSGYDDLGLCAAGAILVTLAFMYRVHKVVGDSVDVATTESADAML
jgi:predicted MFS family arabinose efflux permease